MISFGSCCKDLKDAILGVPESFFRVDDESGVFYLTVGYVNTEKGPGYFDQAVLYCPFCGASLQASEQVFNAAAQAAERSKF